MNYDPTTLPFNSQKIVSSTLHQLINKVNNDLYKQPSKIEGAKGTLSTPIGSKAHKVKVGFKAPVSMTVLPCIVHLYPRVMFLHVLRDGRDIAFSANQVSEMMLHYSLSVHICAYVINDIHDM